MENITLLRLAQKDGGTVPSVYIKNNSRALRKIVKKKPEKLFLLEHGIEREKIFQKKILEYKHISFEVMLSVLEITLRKYMSENGVRLPLGEIYILAPPAVACRIIREIYPMARLFSVLSSDKAAGDEYDEIYFRYGTIIRQLPFFSSQTGEDAIVIRASEERIPPWMKIPVIDMCRDGEKTHKTVDFSRICVIDTFSRELAAEWGGNSGAAFFSMMGRIPEKTATVNLRERADRIFFLDTAAFSAYNNKSV